MTGLAERLIRCAVLVLPRGQRERYREEWAADLLARPDRALRFALSVLVHVLPLRLVLTGHLHPERPMLCQLHLHRYVKVHDNPSDKSIVTKRCSRCGRYKDEWRGPRPANDSLAWAASQAISGWNG